MVKDSTSIFYCSEQQLDKLTEFAFKLNIDKEHSSSFCSKSKRAISEDFLQGISCNCMLACQYYDEIVGILNCYQDKLKNNTDCTLIIDSRICDYNVVAKLLLDKFKAMSDTNMKYTFFFPKENIECANFLESINAKREINEYELILEKGHTITNALNFDITELPIDYFGKFIQLHDSIFPGVYISGADVIEDIGKKHFVYSIIENRNLIAYSVLRLNGGSKATAEIIAVKENFRCKGYGRAIISHLIDKAFTSFEVYKIDLIVDGDNEKAIALYLDLGFVIDAENKCYIA